MNQTGLSQSSDTQRLVEATVRTQARWVLERVSSSLSHVAVACDRLADRVDPKPEPPRDGVIQTNAAS